MISFGIAMAVYSAQNYGAGKYDRIRQGVRQCSMVSLAFCAAAAVAMYFFGRNVISLFTTVHDDLLMEQALLYLKMSVPFYIFLGQIFVYRNAFRGSASPACPSSAASWNWAAAVYRPGPGGHVGYFGICCASPICWVMAALFTGGSYHWVMHTMKAKGASRLLERPFSDKKIPSPFFWEAGCLAFRDVFHPSASIPVGWGSWSGPFRSGNTRRGPAFPGTVGAR